MAIFRKDLKLFFLTPLGPLLTGAVVLLSTYILSQVLNQYQSHWLAQQAGAPEGVSFISEVVLKYVGNLNFLLVFLAPLVAMRIFIEEYKSGTQQLLELSPLSTQKIVFEKFLAVFAIILFLIFVSTIPFLFLLFSAIEDPWIIASAFAALSFNALFYSSIAIFACTLTRSVLLGPFLGIIGIFFFWLLSWSPQWIAIEWARPVLEYSGLLTHFGSAAQGLLQTQDLIYYLTFIAVFVYLSIEFEKKHRGAL